MVQTQYFSAKGKTASRLRQQKHKIVRKYGFPENLLPGSMTQTHRRCGKKGCHCTQDDGHPMWVLSLSIDGRKQTLTLTEAMAMRLEPLVKIGRETREALQTLMAINTQLLRLWREQNPTNHKHNNR